MLESVYQGKLIKKLRNLLPGCVILKNDSSYLQGIPDLIILYKDRWAVLEVKRSRTEPYQPNQEYYILMLNEMSFAARIDPSNEQDVLDALQHAFELRGNARISKR